jgi:hypothetical protein
MQKRIDVFFGSAVALGKADGRHSEARAHVEARLILLL